MKHFFLGFCLSLVISQVFAQSQQRRCATSDMVQYSLETYPHVRTQVEKVEAQVAAYEANAQTQINKSSSVITIPTVVHIVWYEGATNSNVSDEQIYSQIEALNLAFRKQNENAQNIRSVFEDLAADVEIEFCLAQVDPNGNPTDGITRTRTDTRTFDICGTRDIVGQDCELMKYSNKGGRSGWPSDEYLNIWVVNDMSDGVLGYAYLPGTAPNSAVDGFVVIHRAFGTMGSARSPYNGGATSVHEIGHWLGLRHPWGSGDDNSNCNADDGISDTPKIDGSNYTCNKNRNSCGSGQTGDLPDMVENFMDYTDDACTSMFTHGQKTRMRSIIEGNGYHSSVANNSIACNSILQDIDAAIVDVTFPTKEDRNCSSFSPVIQLQNRGREPLFFVNLNYTIGSTGTGQQYVWSYKGEGDGLESLKSELVTLPPISVPIGESPVIVTNDGPMYELIISLNSPNVVEDQDPSNNSLVYRFPIISGGFKNGIDEDFESGTFPPTEWENGKRAVFENFEGASANGNGNTCMYINNLDYPGLYNDDEMILRELDLSAIEAPQLTFDYAYCQLDSAEIGDELMVMFSADCRERWDTVYFKTGYFLATADAQETPFVPEATDWKSVTVDLSDYNAARNATIKFVQVRGQGNNLFLDNINISSSFAVGIEEFVENTPTLRLFPNPATQFTQIDYQIDAASTASYQLNVYDKLGRLIVSNTFTAAQNQGTYFLNTQDLAAGMYFVELKGKQETQQAKLLIVK